MENMKQWLLKNKIPFYKKEDAPIGAKIVWDTLNEGDLCLMYSDIKNNYDIFVEAELLPDTLMYIPNIKKS